MGTVKRTHKGNNMESNAKEFWQRLEDAQRRTGKTNLQALCRIMDIPYQTVINQKCQGRYPSIPVIISLAKMLHCSIDWLLMGSEAEATLRRIQKVVRKIEKITPDQLIALEVFLKDH